MVFLMRISFETYTFISAKKGAVLESLGLEDSTFLYGVPNGRSFLI